MQVPWWLPAVFTIIGIACGYYVHAILTKLKTASAVKTARLTLEEAKREAEIIRKDAELKARDEVIRAREAFENEIKSRRQEILALEDRVSQRETNLDRKVGIGGYSYYATFVA
jgi:ribonucrease Y